MKHKKNLQSTASASSVLQNFIISIDDMKYVRAAEGTISYRTVVRSDLNRTTAR
jgi:hypothetical protein